LINNEAYEKHNCLYGGGSDGQQEQKQSQEQPKIE
jgi:hypothetical protein